MCEAVHASVWTQEWWRLGEVWNRTWHFTVGPRSVHITYNHHSHQVAGTQHTLSPHNMFVRLLKRSMSPFSACLLDQHLISGLHSLVYKFLVLVVNGSTFIQLSHTNVPGPLILPGFAFSSKRTDFPQLICEVFISSGNPYHRCRTGQEIQSAVEQFTISVHFGSVQLLLSMWAVLDAFLWEAVFVYSVIYSCYWGHGQWCTCLSSSQRHVAIAVEDSTALRATYANCCSCLRINLQQIATTLTMFLQLNRHWVWIYSKCSTPYLYIRYIPVCIR